MERRDRFSVTWISKRFDTEEGGNAPMCHFFEDDDPRIRKAVDRWGREGMIVGYTDFIPFTNPRPMMEGFGDEVIVYSKEHGMSILSKKSVNPI